MCDYKYFDGLLTGQKQAFTTKEIVLAYVPMYPELSVAKVFEIAKKVPRIM